MDRQAIIDQIYDNRNAMKRGMQSYLRLAHQQLPVSRAQIELLFIIKHTQPIHSKQVAEELGMTPGGVSQLLDMLFEKSFVGRSPAPNDRRLQLLKLTKKGDKLLAGLQKKREEVMERVISELDDHELAIWLRVQQKMIEQFQQEYNQQKGNK